MHSYSSPYLTCAPLVFVFGKLGNCVLIVEHLSVDGKKKPLLRKMEVCIFQTFDEMVYSLLVEPTQANCVRQKELKHVFFGPQIKL